MKFFLLSRLLRVFMFVTFTVTASAQALPGPNQDAIEQFLANEGYLNWANQPDHLSGSLVGDKNYTVHGHIKVYYSDGVDIWINSSPLPKPTGGLANDEMIVALEYQPATTNPGLPGPLQRIYSMVRHDGGSKGGSYDGWFWSVTDINHGKMVNSEESYGDYGLSGMYELPRRSQQRQPCLPEQKRLDISRRLDARCRSGLQNHTTADADTQTTPQHCVSGIPQLLWGRGCHRCGRPGLPLQKLRSCMAGKLRGHVWIRARKIHYLGSMQRLP